MSSLEQVLAVALALGCGVNAGVFYAFSSFVMQGLGRLSDRDGIVAMQSINVTALRPPFMLAFGGTALLAAVLGVRDVLDGDDLWIAGAGLLGFLGTIGITVAVNVPLNLGVDALDPDAPASAATWRRYLRVWTAWNSARFVACLAGAALATVAMV